MSKHTTKRYDATATDSQPNNLNGIWTSSKEYYNS